MAWVMTKDGGIVEWPGSAELGDQVSTGDPGGGIVVGAGGERGNITEFPGSQQEMNQLFANVVAKGRRLTRGDADKFERHFKDHRDLLIKATGNEYPVSDEGEAAFLNDLSGHIAAGRLRPVGAGTLAKNEPLVYVFRGNVGNAALTLIMKPNGEWQTLLRSGEGMDLGIRLLMNFNSPNPFVSLGNTKSMREQLNATLAILDAYRMGLLQKVMLYSSEHKMQKDLFDNDFAGFVTNSLFNGRPPELLIWNNAFARLTAAHRALSQRDVNEAFIELIWARQYYVYAMKLYSTWKDGIEGAGTKMQVAIGVTAVAMIAAAAAAFAASAAAAGSAATVAAGEAGAGGAAATGTGAGGAAAAADAQTFYRVADVAEQAATRLRVAEVAEEVVTRYRVADLLEEGEELEEATRPLRQMRLGM